MRSSTFATAVGIAVAALVAVAASPAGAQAYPAAAPYQAPGAPPAPPAQAYPAPARPRFAPRPLMPRREAVARAFRYCRNHGFRCELAGVELVGEVWLVDLRAQRGRLRGPLQIGFDAIEREIIAVDEPREAPPPPPPPPAPRLLTSGEAVSAGSEACAQRGYACRLVAATLAMPVWRIDFDARRYDRAGPLHVDVDAYTRAVVRIDEPRPPPPPPRARPMSLEEASRRGLEYCQGRGFACRVNEADLMRRRNVWRVKLAALPPLRGHVRLEFEARTRALLEANEHVHWDGD
jgi:hypothetical protein